MYYRRETYLARIMPFADTECVKVLTGMRRCGKSTMLRMIMDELVSMGRSPASMVHIDLDSRESADIASWTDLYDRVERGARSAGGRAYVFLDELQNVDGWERCVRALVTDLDVDVYITGSSSKMLSGELATHIAGRYVEFEVRPFSFSEVLGLRESEGVREDPEEAFEKYLRYGGMPMVVKLGMEGDDARSALRAMYDSVVKNDVLSRGRVRRTELLEEVLGYAMSEIGHPVSSTNISNYLKSQGRGAAADTVLEYLGAAEDAMFIRKVRRQDLRGRGVLTTDYKYYMTDLGIRQAMGMDNFRDIDQALENVVYNELVARGYDVTVGRAGGREVDFVADRGGTREYYQVCYLLSGEGTAEREFGAFEGIRDGHPRFVLSMDRVDRGRDGVTHRNIVEWLSEGPRRRAPALV